MMMICHKDEICLGSPVVPVYMSDLADSSSAPVVSATGALGEAHRAYSGVRNRRNGISVRRSCFGWKTSGYFLTSVDSGYFRFISGYISTIAVSIVVGLAAPKPPSQVSAGIYPFPVGILLPVRIPFPVRRSYLYLPALVTGLPWRRPVLRRDGSQRVSDRFPGALGRNPTRRTDR